MASLASSDTVISLLASEVVSVKINVAIVVIDNLKTFLNLKGRS